MIGTRMHAWIEAGSWPDVTSPRIGGLSLIVMPVEASATLLLALGLLLCLAGMFAPLSRRR